jgi:hypothetical protein
VAEVIDKRMANALFANAAPASLDVVPGEILIRLVLSAFRKAYGGLWVGGTAMLTREALSFKPNAMNRAVHENGAALHFELPLAQVRSVAYRPALFTAIIDVTTAAGTFSLRCYGAKKFANAIRTAVGPGGPSA